MGSPYTEIYSHQTLYLPSYQHSPVRRIIRPISQVNKQRLKTYSSVTQEEARLVWSSKLLLDQPYKGREIRNLDSNLNVAGY